MKDNFTSSLTGKKWWKPFLCFIILFLAVNIPQELSSMHYNENPDAIDSLSTFLFGFVMIGLMAVIEAFFMAVLYRIFYASVSVRNKTFAFTGTAGDLVKLFLPGILLTAITLGFYLPRFEKRLVSYIAEHSELDKERFHFQGSTRKLYKYYILGCVLPIIAWFACFVFVLVFSGISLESTTALSSAGIILVVIFTAALFLMLIPFIYLNYKWMLDLKWKESRITWKTDFGPSCGFILGQFALTLITVGIYWPAMLIKIYRYFAGKTVMLDNGKEKSRFGFEGKMSQGFGLLWGQTLLCIITLGIYSPWAVAKIANYFITSTFIEEKQGLITE